MAATLKSRFPEIEAEMRLRLSAAVKETAEEIAKTAKERAPVGTPPEDPHPGRLRDSIHVERKGSAAYAVVADAQADRRGTEQGAPYGKFVEFGVQGHPAQPFLIPAAELGRVVGEALARAVLRGL